MSFSMLRLVLLTVLLTSNINTVSADTDMSSSIQPLAVHSLVLDSTLKADTAVAVGERGHLFVFDDNWQQRPSPTQAHLTKVFLLDDKLGWAVGHDATVLHTQDSGLSWQVQMSSPEIEKPLMDVLFFDELNGIAIGAYGMFYRSKDGGNTWEPEFHGELLFEEDIAYLEDLKAEDEALYLSERSTLLPHFNRVVPLDDSRLLMVGELGLAAVSEDKGISWQRLDFPYDGSLFNALVTSKGVYVMGLRGHLFKSEDGANSWQEIALPIQSTLNGGLIIDDNKIRLVGNAGVIIDVYHDGAVAMVAQRQGENLVTISRDTNGKQWVAGTKGFFELKQE